MFSDIRFNKWPNLILDEKVKENKPRYFRKMAPYLGLLLGLIMGYTLLECRHLNLLFFAHLHYYFLQANRFSTVGFPPKFNTVLLFVKIFDEVIDLFLVCFRFDHLFSLRDMAVVIKCLRQGASHIKNQKVNVPLKNDLFENTKGLGEKRIHKLYPSCCVIDVVIC